MVNKCKIKIYYVELMNIMLHNACLVNAITIYYYCNNNMNNKLNGLALGSGNGHRATNVILYFKM